MSCLSILNNNFSQFNAIYNLKALERLYYQVMVKVMNCMESSINPHRMLVEILVDTSSQIQFITTCLYFNVYYSLDQSILVLN